VTVERSAKNISLYDTCSHCSRRIWFKDEERKTSRVYHPPVWLRALFKNKIGTSPLGPYYLDRCEVCGKQMAIFANNRGVLYDKVVVLYACTLLDTHLDNTDSFKCELTNTCYDCPLKKGEMYVAKL
jgi:hypothetical protein